MESQMPQPQAPHSVGHQMDQHGEDDQHHHEKTSVLKKVKAKAKKIKDTLTKHGHGHDHGDHDHIPDDHDLDEEEDDDEDEEMVEDPEVHGAPIYASAAIMSVRTVEGSTEPGVKAGRSTAMDVDLVPPGPPGSYVRETLRDNTVGLTGEGPKSPQNTPVAHTTDTHHTRSQDPTRTFVPDQEEHQGQPKVNLQRPKGGLVEDPAAPKDAPGAYDASNYQSKVTDPTGEGGEEAGISPVLFSFDKMGIYDESNPKSGQETNSPAGAEDFPASLPTGSTRTGELPHDNTSINEGTFDRTGAPERQQDNPEGNTEGQSNQSSYYGKMSSATSAIVDKAVSAKNVVASKLGYGGEQGNTAEEVDAAPSAGDKSNNSMPATAAGYGQKIAGTMTGTLTPVYEKVANAGSTVMSKMPGAKAGAGGEKENVVGGQDKGVSVKDYLADKLRPGEEDKALSEVISEALHKKNAEGGDNSATSRPLSEVFWESMHLRKNEPDDATNNRPMGKVTESEEVARRLGTTEHDPSKEGMNSSFVDTSSSTGMVERIKDAVGSWLGGTQGPQQSRATSGGSAAEGAAGNTTTSERRLQESGN